MQQVRQVVQEMELVPELLELQTLEMVAVEVTAEAMGQAVQAVQVLSLFATQTLFQMQLQQLVRQLSQILVDIKFTNGLEAGV
jgi:hypothetical protein